MLCSSRSCTYRDSGSDFRGPDASESWDAYPSDILYPYHAKCLVGPGGAVALGIGTYIIYLKITDNPEIPFDTVGQLQNHMTDDESGIQGGRSAASSSRRSWEIPRPREFRDDEGVRIKEVTDEANNITTFHNTGDTERVDVMIRPETVVQRMTS